MLVETENVPEIGVSNQQLVKSRLSTNFGCFFAHECVWESYSDLHPRLRGLLALCRQVFTFELTVPKARGSTGEQLASFSAWYILLVYIKEHANEDG